MMVFTMTALPDNVSLVTKVSIVPNFNQKMTAVNVLMVSMIAVALALLTKPLIIVRFMIVLVKIDAKSAISLICCFLILISVCKCRRLKIVYYMKMKISANNTKMVFITKLHKWRV